MANRKSILPGNSQAPTLADLSDSLAGIAAVAALLSGAQASEVDRTAIALLIRAHAECAALQLERLAEDAS
jgi:hypothetical protein